MSSKEPHEELHEVVLLGTCGASQIQQALDALRRACAGAYPLKGKDPNYLLARALRPFTLGANSEDFARLASESDVELALRLLNNLDIQLRQGLATWDDLYHLEKLVLEVATLDELRRRKIELVTDFNLYAGPMLKAKYEGYAAGLYHQAFPESPSPAQPSASQAAPAPPPTQEDILEAGLRHECLFLQHLIHDILTVRPHQERKRVDINGMLLQCAAGLCLILGLLGLCSWQISNRTIYPFTIFVLWSGIAGAFISTVIRLQDSAREGMMILNTTRHVGQTRDYFTAILLGAGAGLLSYLVLIAGVGSIHPADTSNPVLAAARSFSDLLSRGPTGAIDKAKVLVFAFGAGFLERFVPDTIDNVPGLGTRK